MKRAREILTFPCQAISRHTARCHQAHGNPEHLHRHSKRKRLELERDH